MRQVAELFSEGRFTRMMISREHYQQTEGDLRGLIDAGASLGDALRVLHHDRHVGTMLLWPAVMTIRQVDKQEAMRIVVHETSAWRSDRKVSQ